jgi:hypothetical protein
MLVSRMVTLGWNSQYQWGLADSRYSLEVEEAIFSDCDVTPIVRKKGWLDESSVANSADKFPEEFKTLVANLVICDGLCVEVVKVRSESTT